MPNNCREIGTDHVFCYDCLTNRSARDQPLAEKSAALCGRNSDARHLAGNRSVPDLFRRRRLSPLPRHPLRGRRREVSTSARVRAHDQPCPPADDRGVRRGCIGADEGRRTAVCPVCQPSLSPDRHAVRRTLPLLPGASGYLPARLPTLHRAESRSCRYGRSTD